MHFVTFVMFYTCTLTPCYHGNGNASHTGLHHTHTHAGDSVSGSGLSPANKGFMAVKRIFED